MTRLWIGIGLMLVLLLVGIFLWSGITPFHENLASKLDSAAMLALDGNWEQAQKVAFTARDQWLHFQDCIAAVIDHEPMEQMHALFRELSLLQSNQAVDFASVCVHLAETSRAIGETQSLKWWGI